VFRKADDYEGQMALSPQVLVYEISFTKMNLAVVREVTRLMPSQKYTEVP
jgi:hypothetical protein